MKCTQCGCIESKVIDSRSNEDSTVIKRRRECTECGRRFTTFETVETIPLVVIKSNGNRQTFDPNKIKAGIIKSCDKRPVPMYKVDKLVAEITKALQNSLESEISSKKIGELVMAGLKEIDEVAYVRFASVYRQFTDISSFLKEIEQMIGQDKKEKS